MKNQIIALGIAAAIGLGTNVAHSEEDKSTGWQIGGIRIANPLDSNTWWDGEDKVSKEKIVINFVDPEFWMSIPDPKKHSKVHAAITNPETWAQFLKVETYMAMADINVLKKWLDVKTYDVLLDPQTYAYWAQPGAYKHLANVENYAQLARPSAYVGMMDQGLETLKLAYNATMGITGSKIADILPSQQPKNEDTAP